METEEEEGGDPFEAPESPGKEGLYGHHRQDDFFHARWSINIWAAQNGLF
jgi:hypothetical protein